MASLGEVQACFTIRFVTGEVLAHAVARIALRGGDRQYDQF